MSFVDSNNGWIVSDNGILFKTNNGGVSWISQNLDPSYFIEDVFFIHPDTGWVVGRGRLISHTDAGGITTIKSDSQPQLIGPRDFLLYQNYPNPFNSLTTILFELFKPGFVNLTVHNINGQTIEILLDKYCPPGKI